MAQIEIISTEDQLQFKNELIQEIKAIIKPARAETKQWVRSADVRKMLKISPGTLRTLRINGTLRFTRVGSTMFYKYEDIVRLLDNKEPDMNKVHLFQLAGYIQRIASDNRGEYIAP